MILWSLLHYLDHYCYYYYCYYYYHGQDVNVINRHTFTTTHVGVSRAKGAPVPGRAEAELHRFHLLLCPRLFKFLLAPWSTHLHSPSILSPFPFVCQCNRIRTIENKLASPVRNQSSVSRTSVAFRLMKYVRLFVINIR